MQDGTWKGGAVGLVEVEPGEISPDGATGTVRMMFSAPDEPPHGVMVFVAVEPSEDPAALQARMLASAASKAALFVRAIDAMLGRPSRFKPEGKAVPPREG